MPNQICTYCPLSLPGRRLEGLYKLVEKVLHVVPTTIGLSCYSTTNLQRWSDRHRSVNLTSQVRMRGTYYRRSGNFSSVPYDDEN